MIQYFFSLIFYICFITNLYSQQKIFWGSKVIDVSSEFGILEFSALQALNAPNVYPREGSNQNAWRPKNMHDNEFIMVSFDDPIRARQIAVVETENPGATVKIYAYDKDYNEHLLHELKARILPIEKRLLNLFFEYTDYPIKAIRLELDGNAVPGYNSIDAIGISSDKIPIKLMIDSTAGVTKNIEHLTLGDSINTESLERSPLVSPDGKRLYFSRRKHPGNMGGIADEEDIWVSKLDETTGYWLPAENIGMPLNTKGPNFVSSITRIGDRELLVLGNEYGKNDKMYAGASYSFRSSDGSYSDPIALDIQNDYNHSKKADFFMVREGDYFLMSIERDDTYGLRDLYVSKNMIGNQWTEPINLGEVINTLGEECTPFMSNDKKTLYFSSDGHLGYGNLDIYFSKRLDDTWTNWSYPENLGIGINDEDDNEYLSIPHSGDYLYFTSGDKEKNTDLYRLRAENFLTNPLESSIYTSVKHLLPEIPQNTDAIPDKKKSNIVIYGNVINKRSNKSISLAKISALHKSENTKIGNAFSDLKGYYELSIDIPTNNLFLINVEKDGFESAEKQIDLTIIQHSDSLEIDLELFPLEKIDLQNVLFNFAERKLTDINIEILDRLVNYMNKGIISRIRVAGHTDSIGTEEFNLKLSYERAQIVVDYLTYNGINMSSIEYKWYGESLPIADNNSEVGRNLNRRVEFHILEAN